MASTLYVLAAALTFTLCAATESSCAPNLSATDFRDAYCSSNVVSSNNSVVVVVVVVVIVVVVVVVVLVVVVVVVVVVRVEVVVVVEAVVVEAVEVVVVVVVVVAIVEVVKIIYTFGSFTASQVFRGSPANAQSIGVGRNWNNQSPCSDEAFPDSNSGLLVFGNGNSGNYFTVNTCQRIFSWDCIPQSVKDSLPLDCSN
ncbi:hypothetical protein ElyMa_002877600 [Elysia marginata]|uniref:Chitin-binding type-2 domain-containing protein n=1 Tax=Elysia marginata TaxID=1093978 RepID=A0AAV4I060_9GAST|nr:hypothetical protein ElyMa_002877600 [Elysia marginata]